MANNYISDLTTPEAIQRIWEKGIIVDGYNASLYRQDFAGAWISREAYGDTDNILGWEIDHVYPDELGGGNHIENLRPMNWRNNRSKGTDYPHYTAVVTSKGGTEHPMTLYKRFRGQEPTIDALLIRNGIKK